MPVGRSTGRPRKRYNDNIQNVCQRRKRNSVAHADNVCINASLASYDFF